MNAGLYGGIVYKSNTNTSNATATDGIKLTLDGYVIYVYSLVFKEPYPEKPYTPEQIGRINEIWVALGHPEKQISG